MLATEKDIVDRLELLRRHGPLEESVPIVAERVSRHRDLLGAQRGALVAQADAQRRECLPLTPTLEENAS